MFKLLIFLLVGLVGFNNVYCSVLSQTIAKKSDFLNCYSDTPPYGDK